MKRTIYLMAIIAIGILGCQISTASLIDLGTVEYEDYLQVDITYPNEVNLTYIHSTVSQSALDFIKLNYIPATHKTRYIFTSNPYQANYWENLSDELFIYQDNESKQLFAIYINMADTEIPENPWMVKYLNVSEFYNKTLDELEEALDNLSQMQIDLDNLILDYNNLKNETNDMEFQNDNLSSRLNNISKKYRDKYNELNLTKEKLLNETTNSTTYKNFFVKMTSDSRYGFDFKIAGEDDYYTSIYGYEKQLDDKDQQIAAFPLILIFVVFVAITLSMMLGYWKWGKHKPGTEELQIETNVDPQTSKFNKFTSLLSFRPKHAKVKKTDAEKNQEIKKEFDNKIAEMDKKIAAHHDELLKKLDTVISSTKTDKKVTN